MNFKLEVFYNARDETLAEFVQRSCRWPIPGNIQGQIKQDFEQPGAVKEISAHCRWLKQKDFLRSLATQIILRFYNSKSKTSLLQMYVLLR